MSASANAPRTGTPPFAQIKQVLADTQDILQQTVASVSGAADVKHSGASSTASVYTQFAANSNTQVSRLYKAVGSDEFLIDTKPFVRLSVIDPVIAKYRGLIKQTGYKDSLPILALAEYVFHLDMKHATFDGYITAFCLLNSLQTTLGKGQPFVSSVLDYFGKKQWPNALTVDMAMKFLKLVQTFEPGNMQLSLQQVALAVKKEALATTVVTPPVSQQAPAVCKP